MKASHLFLLGVIFAFVWNIVRDLVNDYWNVDGGYSYVYVILVITLIILWYKIDEKLNKTYQVTKWN